MIMKRFLQNAALVKCPSCGEKTLYAEEHDGHMLLHCFSESNCSLNSIISAGRSSNIADTFREEFIYRTTNRKVYLKALETPIIYKTRSGETWATKLYRPYILNYGTTNGLGKSGETIGYEFKWRNPVTGRFFTPDGVPPVYRPQSSISEYADESELYITQDEFDADTLATAGLNAICLANGTKSQWHPEYIDYTNQRTVFIIPKNDNAGHEYAKRLASDLYEDAEAVKIVSPSIIAPIQISGQLSDLYDGKEDGEALKTAIREAAAETQEFAPPDIWSGIRKPIEFTEEERKPVKYLVDGIIPEIGITMLFSTSKTGKSLLALQLAAAVASGGMFLERKAQKAGVIYFDLENVPAITYERMQKMSLWRYADKFYICNELHETLANGTLIDRLRQLHRDRPDIRLFILDTYSRVRGSSSTSGMNAYDFDVKLLAPLVTMTNEEKISVLFVHHTTKGFTRGGSDPQEAASGSAGIVASSTQNIALFRDQSDDPDEVLATMQTRGRIGADIELKLKRNPFTLSWEVYHEPQTDPEDTELMQVFRPWIDEQRDQLAHFYSNAEIKELTGLTLPEIRDQLKRIKRHLHDLYRIDATLTHTERQRGIRLTRRRRD